ncbi:DDB1- and CUL4-associated factor 12-B-like [Convolutriloba macropyga]|uniref:DDB1- and CUL4-associated factor 12-B-like n=1 Tax=Convolutriloba macropyga TaxID=536237 RepID=UPI003F51D695
MLDPSKMSLHEYIYKRAYGLAGDQPQVRRSAMFKNYSPLTMREVPIAIPDTNKIFASKWISHSEIAFGTKCNQLKVLNVNNQSRFSIPLLKRQNVQSRGPLTEREQRQQQPSNCGIHMIAVNPSETRLATGGENPNDIAVYSLPQIDPLVLGEKGHGDWVFCGSWLDDEFIVTGSRDNYLCLWHISSDDDFTHQDCSSSKSSSSFPIPGYAHQSPLSSFMTPSDEDSAATIAESSFSARQLPSAQSVASCEASDQFEVPFYSPVQPLAKKLCQTSDRVRAMALNTRRQELAVTSLNGYIHTWDPGLMKQTRSEKLVDCQETVTLCYSAEHNLYCCGSYQYLMFFDPRTMRLTQCYGLRDKETGIRSLATVDDVLTIGTGKGLIRFFDLSANRFITCNCGVDWSLKAGNGRITDNATSIPDILNIPPSEYRHAIYTLAYDRSRSRLFSAGGPLHAQISGNYAALWV